VSVNGQTTNNPSITDVQVNGFDGSDTITVSVATIPVVFNGGNGDDWLIVSDGNLGGVTAQVTYNGGAGYDTAIEKDSSNSNFAETYQFNGDTIQRATDNTGILKVASDVDDTELYANDGNDAIYLNSITVPTHIGVVAGNGGDLLYIDMNTM